MDRIVVQNFLGVVSFEKNFVFFTDLDENKQNQICSVSQKKNKNVQVRIVLFISQNIQDIRMMGYCKIILYCSMG